nr:hypothetical protein GCM10020063_019250 [Dactylosporangium thailandense]
MDIGVLRRGLRAPGDLPAADVMRRLTATAVPLGAAHDDRVGAPGSSTRSRRCRPRSHPRLPALRRWPRPWGGIGERWGVLLGVFGILVLAALLAYLGRLALRAARQRRADPEASVEPTDEPPDIRLA